MADSISKIKIIVSNNGQYNNPIKYPFEKILLCILCINIHRIMNPKQVDPSVTFHCIYVSPFLAVFPRVCWVVSSLKEDLHPVLVLGTIGTILQVNPFNEYKRYEFSFLIFQNLRLQCLKKAVFR